MAELALYRKWRSKDFEDLLGQPHLTQTLKNALQSGKIAHAYLFCGPRGTGKTSAAKILAKALNCEKGPNPNPCNECAICRGIAQGNILDCIEIDAASNRGIDEIRDLRDKVRFAPTQCRTKVYIIDEVHMLTTEAFNALLKTLEEPPPQTVFVLCTTEPYKLLPTVASRCQRFDFRRISFKIIEARLREVCAAERVDVEPGVFPLIAQAADGSLRDALGLLDQLRTYGSGRIGKEEAGALLGQTPGAVVWEFAKLIADGDLKQLLIYFHDVLDHGIDLTQLIRALLAEFRRVLLFKIAPDVLRLSPDEASLLEPISARLESEEFYRILRVLADLRQELRASQHPELSAELSLMRLLQAQWEPSLEGLKRRLDGLEPRASSSREISAPAKLPPPMEVQAPIDLSLETVQTRWPEFIEKLRSSRNTLFAILQEAKPMKLDGNVLTLVFTYEFHKNRFLQKKQETEKLLEEKLGMALNLAGRVNEVDHEAFVREATELFPGAVIVQEA